METGTAVSAPHPRHDLFGLPFDALTMTQAMDRCRAAIQGGEYLSVGVVNAAKVMTMRRDSHLREAGGRRGVGGGGRPALGWGVPVPPAPLPHGAGPVRPLLPTS